MESRHVLVADLRGPLMVEASDGVNSTSWTLPGTWQASMLEESECKGDLNTGADSRDAFGVYNIFNPSEMQSREILYFLFLDW